MSKTYDVNDRGYRFRGFVSHKPGISCVFDIRQFPRCFVENEIHARSTCLRDSKKMEIFEHDVLEFKSAATEHVRHQSTGKSGPMLFVVVWRYGEPRLIDLYGHDRADCLDSDKWLRCARVVGNIVLDNAMRTEFAGYVELP